MMNILVVEDDLLVSRAIARMLKSLPSVSFVATAFEAARFLASTVPAALVVDVILPDGSGFDTIRYARQLYPSVPAVVMSGRSDRSVINLAFDLNVEYLVKPFESSQLLAFLKRAELRQASGGRALDTAIEVTRIEFGLTVRETEILKLSALGVRRAELAIVLGCEESTVKSHINKILDRTKRDSLPEVVGDMFRRALHASAT